jgi:hypothetical protein
MNDIPELPEPAPTHNFAGNRPETKWERLSRRVPKKQQEQIAEMLLQLMDAGWGRLEISVKDSHIKEFAVVTTVPAKNP